VKSAIAQEEMRKFKAVVQIFRKYGDQYGMDWMLMAAQGYQESRLDQGARSAAGAVGVMQVLPATGRQLGVGDVTKLDPNIHAGVKYIRFMIDQYFKDEPMTDLDKGLFAFASYNAGPARIRQLRSEAAKRCARASRPFRPDPDSRDLARTRGAGASGSPARRAAARRRKAPPGDAPPQTIAATECRAPNTTRA
jgi:membrane-bound lytic murein transglycosylase MltF